jgi:hypothetical protein
MKGKILQKIRQSFPLRIFFTVFPAESKFVCPETEIGICHYYEQEDDIS